MTRSDTNAARGQRETTSLVVHDLLGGELGADGFFDEDVAARYDESSAAMFDPAAVEPVVDLLAELAGEGRALELGIGTGRIALPLASEVSRCTGSSSRGRWSRACGRSREVRRSA